MNTSNLENENLLKLLVLHDDGGEEDKFFAFVSTMCRYVAQNVESGRDHRDFYFDWYEYDSRMKDWKYITHGILFTAKTDVSVDYKSSNMVTSSNHRDGEEVDEDDSNHIPDLYLGVKVENDQKS